MTDNDSEATDGSDATDDSEATDDATVDEGEVWLDGVGVVPAAAWSLACRRQRTLSQRELASTAGLSHGAVERLETGRGRTSYDTVARVLAAGGYELVAVDALGGLLVTDDAFVGPADRAGRRMPVHLSPQRTRPYFGAVAHDYRHYDPRPWWGWHRIAWADSDPAVPRWTYHRRPRHGWGRT